MQQTDPILKVYVEQLRGNKNWSLDAKLEPLFIGVEEKELKFKDPVFIEGRAYLAENNLVISASMQTKAEMPCKVCNEFFKLEIAVEGLVHVEPLTALKRGYVDISPILREAILLEIPVVAECRKEGCPKRKEVEKLLQEREEGYQPFSSL